LTLLYDRLAATSINAKATGTIMISRKALFNATVMPEDAGSLVMQNKSAKFSPLTA
jgi:hypothetical protein